MPLVSAHHLNRNQAIRQHAQQIAAFKCDAAFGWGKARPRQMQENRTPAPACDRRIIPAKHANHVVNRIFPPQNFVPRRMGQADLRIVGGVARVIAPAIIRGEGRHRHGGVQRREAVRTIEQAPQRQIPYGSRAIAFALIGADAALANGATINRTLEAQQPIGANARGSRSSHTLAQHMAKAARFGVQIGVVHAIRVKLMRFAAHHLNPAS